MSGLPGATCRPWENHCYSSTHKKPSGAAINTVWWKFWKPATLDGQRGHIQWPPLLQMGPQTLCSYTKILFSKTAECLEKPSWNSKNTPPAVPVRTHTPGKVTFIHCHKKEPWSSPLPLRWDLPPALYRPRRLFCLSLWPYNARELPRPCPIHSLQIRVGSNKKMKERGWRAAGKQWWKGGRVCVGGWVGRRACTTKGHTQKGSLLARMCYRLSFRGKQKCISSSWTSSPHFDVMRC